VKKRHHHTPTLEEITHKFKESTVFSKPDARDGYWFVVPDEESSYLPPLTAHLDKCVMKERMVTFFEFLFDAPTILIKNDFTTDWPAK